MQCNRCEIDLSKDPVPIGQSNTTVSVPNIPDFTRFAVMCGDCTLQLVEFMVPLRDDAMRAEYASMRAEYNALLIIRREQVKIGEERS